MRHVTKADLSDAEQAYLRRWSLAAASAFAPLSLLLTSGAFLSTDPPLRPRAAAPHHACASWDETARATVSGLMREPGDAALRQVGEAIFQLRRARRNCEHGWLRLACQDYQAIAGRKETDPLPVSSPICWPALQTNAAATD